LLLVVASLLIADSLLVATSLLVAASLLVTHFFQIPLTKKLLAFNGNGIFIA